MVDSYPVPEQDLGEMTPEQAQLEISKLNGDSLDPAHPISSSAEGNPSIHPQRKQYQEYKDKLFQVAYPDNRSVMQLENDGAKEEFEARQEKDNAEAKVIRGRLKKEFGYDAGNGEYSADVPKFLLEGLRAQLKIAEGEFENARIEVRGLMAGIINQPDALAQAAINAFFYSFGDDSVIEKAGNDVLRWIDSEKRKQFDNLPENVKEQLKPKKPANT